MLGVVRSRHRLLPSLELEGGHIGYDIRPSARRQGHGTAILALALGRARALGLRGVLLTCDEDNLGSVRIIEDNGGRRLSSGVSEHGAKPILRYRIDL